ncbi:polysaccharide deacetylase family protein [Bacillus pacificus]
MKFNHLCAPKEAPKQYNGQVRKVAYLTFDDGPGKYTAELLDMLKRKCKSNILPYWFKCKAFPDLVKREDAEGHYVGMHSMTHNYKKLYTEGRYVDEMKEDQGLIAGVLGKSPVLTRPSY